MNWVDFLIIVVILLAVLQGLRRGFVKTIFVLIGVVLAALIGAQVADPIGKWIGNSVENESVATVIAYAIGGFIVFIVVQIIGSIIAKILKMLFLGPIDMVAGGALGALGGIVVAGFIIAIMARLAIMPVSGEDLLGQREVKVREGMANALVDSSLVGAYLKAEEKLPANAFGLVPGDFDKAFDELRSLREDKSD